MKKCLPIALSAIILVGEIDAATPDNQGDVRQCSSTNTEVTAREKVSFFESLLLEPSSDVEAVFNAAKKQDNATVKDFIEKGFDPNSRNDDLFRKTLIDTAMSCGNLELVKYLHEEKNVPLGAEILFSAIQFGNLEFFKYLVEEKGADPFASNRYGNTVLKKALGCNALPIVRYLVEEKGAILDINGEYESEIFRDNVQSGCLEVVKYLIENGADVNATYRGETLLHMAVRFGKPEIVKCLIENGADVNATYRGETLLHSAVYSNNLEIFKYLVEEKGFAPFSLDELIDTVLVNSPTLQIRDIIIYLAEKEGASPSEIRLLIDEYDEISSVRNFVRLCSNVGMQNWAFSGDPRSIVGSRLIDALGDSDFGLIILDHEDLSVPIGRS